jgi:hypothetical protein
MHFFGWQTMDPAFGDGDPIENGDGFLFHPIGQGARQDQLPDLSKVAAVIMMMVRLIMVVMMMLPMVMMMLPMVVMMMLPMVVMMMVVGMLVIVGMAVVVVLLMCGVIMIIVMVVSMMMVVMTVVGVQVDIELGSGDTAVFSAADMQVISFEPELGEFKFERARIHPQVQQRANEHITAYSAEEIEVKGLHGQGLAEATRALIWLAA